MSDFPNDQDIQWSVQNMRHFRSDNHSPARQPKDQVSAHAFIPQILTQLSTRIFP
jgi:hypothetical protein